MSAGVYVRDGQIIVDVDDPGYGRLALRVEDEADEPGQWHEVAGAAIGRLLAEVTSAALEQRPANLAAARVPGLRGQLDTDLMRELLPGLHRMALLAAAGTDRYERVYAEDDSADEPLCANCNEGSPYHQAVTISERCLEYGHASFGVRSGR